MRAAETMTSLQRTLTTLGHAEPDRVPLFLLNNLHGSKELGLTPEEYFASPEYVTEGQLRLRRKYGDDCLYSFFYAAVEVEAWGGEVIYIDEGPPNAGQPIVGHFDDIFDLHVPVIGEIPVLNRVLRATELMKAEIGDEAPIIGVVMSPFSLPVMQMGFEDYLLLLFEHPEAFRRLMEVNVEFCIRWANAQLAAGATAICYFDPVSSPTIIPREMYGDTGYRIARETLPRIEGPTATHLASGRVLPIAGQLTETATAALGVGESEDLCDLKATFSGKLSLLGNLNGIEMVGWNERGAHAAVADAIARAGAGGGFILSDNHGEIPFQVSSDTMMAIADAVREYGRYPLDGDVRDA